MTEPKPFKTGCFVCGETPDAYGARGLCQKHYRQFNAKLASIREPELAKAFEERAIELGWVLPKSGGGRPKSWSPFDAIAEQVAEEQGDYSREAAAKLADEIYSHDKPRSATNVAKRKKGS